MDLSTSVRAFDRPLRLNLCERDDILWLHAVAADWNGFSWFDSLGLRAPTLVLRSDASGAWGCRALLIFIRCLGELDGTDSLQQVLYSTGQLLSRAKELTRM